MTYNCTRLSHFVQSDPMEFSGSCLSKTSMGGGGEGGTLTTMVSFTPPHHKNKQKIMVKFSGLSDHIIQRNQSTAGVRAIAVLIQEKSRQVCLLPPILTDLIAHRWYLICWLPVQRWHVMLLEAKNSGFVYTSIP